MKPLILFFVLINTEKKDYCRNVAVNSPHLPTMENDIRETMMKNSILLCWCVVVGYSEPGAMGLNLTQDNKTATNVKLGQNTTVNVVGTRL